MFRSSVLNVLFVCLFMASHGFGQSPKQHPVSVQSDSSQLDSTQAKNVQKPRFPRFRRAVIGSLALIGSGFVMSATNEVWFPVFEKLTANNVEARVVERNKTLRVLVQLRDSDTGEYKSEVYSIENRALVFLYDTLGLWGVADKILSELYGLGIEDEIYRFNEELVYEVIIFDDSEERSFEVAEEVYDTVKAGRKYRFKVSRFDSNEIVGSERID